LSGKMKLKQMIGRFTAGLLSVLLLASLAGCGSGETAGNGQEHTDFAPEEMSGETLGAGYAADHVFSLHIERDKSLNPISTVSSANMLVDSLVYETLFEVDGNYEVSSRLVKDWSTIDGGTTWLFHMDESVLFHDGGGLTAYDAAYSIGRAQRTAYYGTRLSLIYGVSAMDNSLLMISLQYPNMQFPSRLVVPIIRDGTMNDEVPPGTGRYRYSEDLSKLTVFQEHPDADRLPVEEIYLKSFSDAGAAILGFEDSLIDLVTNNPTGTNSLGYGGSNEVRYYGTNNMHYLGFNTFSYFLCYPEYRRALNYAVDRDYIVREAMNGYAVASALPISPQSPLFNENLNAALSYSLTKCLRAFDDVEVADHDMDGKLEYMVTGIPIEINIDFIVCGESSAKRKAARKIADDMKSMGLTVNLRELSWRDYEKALEEGDFDMYYGEVRLTADFDLMPFLSNKGKLNYGGFKDVGYEAAVAAYLAADDAGRAASCDAMCSAVAQYATIIPICFEKEEVISHRGVISGLNPNQYSIFHNMTEWTMNLDG
jgi:peptide/nickel transport system substrate-binding protein